MGDKPPDVDPRIELLLERYTARICEKVQKLLDEHSTKCAVHELVDTVYGRGGEPGMKGRLATVEGAVTGARALIRPAIIAVIVGGVMGLIQLLGKMRW